MINSTVSCHEKIDLEGIDSICATARFFLGASSSGGNWQIPSEKSFQDPFQAIGKGIALEICVGGVWTCARRTNNL